MEELIREAHENDYTHVVIKVSLEGESSCKFFYNELEAENYYWRLNEQDYPSQMLIETKKYYHRDVVYVPDLNLDREY